MFVRWKKRKLKGKWWDRDVKFSRYAYLVESYRDKSGQPRQRYLSYLGSIGGDKQLSSWIAQEFWRSARSKLDKLDLSNDQRKKIESKLEETVPHSSEALINYSEALFNEAVEMAADL